MNELLHQSEKPFNLSEWCGRNLGQTISEENSWTVAIYSLVHFRTLFNFLKGELKGSNL